MSQETTGTVAETSFSHLLSPFWRSPRKPQTSAIRVLQCEPLSRALEIEQALPQCYTVQANQTQRAPSLASYFCRARNLSGWLATVNSRPLDMMDLGGCPANGCKISLLCVFWGLSLEGNRTKLKIILIISGQPCEKIVSAFLCLQVAEA